VPSGLTFKAQGTWKGPGADGQKPASTGDVDAAACAVSAWSNGSDNDWRQRGTGRGQIDTPVLGGINVNVIIASV